MAGALLLTTAIVWQMGNEPALLRPGERIEGTIGDGDPVVQTEVLVSARYAEQPTLGKTYRLEVDQPGTYHVDLRSDFFDGYLVLRDESGGVRAEDDDGLIGLHARLVVNLEPGSEGQVQACALHGGRGTFELSLHRGEPEVLDARGRAEASIADGYRRIEALERVEGAQSLELALALHKLGVDLWNLGRYPQATPLLERALGIREAVLGSQHPTVARSLNSLAALRYAQGAYAEARPLYERALAIREAALGSNHPDVANSLNNLALLLQAQGSHDEARALLERALGIYEQALGSDHPQVAMILNNLANVRVDQSSYGEAQRLYERALAIREAALGSQHPDLAVTLNHLGELLHVQGRYADARPLYERALAIREATLGGAHPAVATTLNNLAELLQAEGAYGEARPLLERALQIQEAALGSRHPTVALGLNNLAMLLWQQGAYAEARPLLERALRIKEEALGSQHPDVAISLVNLGELVYSRGAYAEARPLFERALAILEATLGGAHPQVATTLSNLAKLLVAQGSPAEARPLLERALAIQEATLGGQHPDTASGLTNLAQLLQAQGLLAEARPMFERALAIREAALGSDHPLVAQSLNNLAVLLVAQRAHAEARPLLERALAIRQEALGGDHPDVAETLNNLALALFGLGALAEARPLYEQALAILERSEHPRLAQVLTNLAVLLADRDAGAEAWPLLVRAGQIRRAHLGPSLASLSEAEGHLYLSTLRWQQELMLSPAFWQAGSQVEAYESLLAWKGQVLRAARLGRERLRAAWIPRDRELLDRLHETQAELSRITAGLDAGTGERRLEELLDERRSLERTLRERDETEVPSSPSWTELQEALPEDAALVDWIVHPVYQPARWEGQLVVEERQRLEPRVSAWVTRRDRPEPEHVDMGPAAVVEEAVERLLDHYVVRRGEPLSKPPDPNDVLRSLIWDPLAPHLEGARTVFLSPDGVLATLPFEILRDPGGIYLVEERGFVYLTDPTMLVEIAARPAAQQHDSLLALGGVDYLRAEALGSPISAGAPSNLPRGQRTDVWEPLEATASEAKRIAARHELSHPRGTRKVLAAAAATEEALKAELPAASVLHLATHGYFQPEGWASLEEAATRTAEELPEHAAPGQQGFWDMARRLEGMHPGLLCGLVCAGVNGGLPEGRDDGYLTAEEVSWLDLSACDLVVLSACDTGLGRSQSGEGLLGLRRAFLTAGSRTVLSSLWSVRDQETADLMDLFYRNLWQGGLGPHAALRAAQLETLARNRARHAGDARPFTWGAFVLDGDWR